MNQIIQFRYKNHRGEVSLRKVVPISLIFTSTDWHPELQWILHADDLDKGAMRSFALKDCNFVVTS